MCLLRSVIAFFSGSFFFFVISYLFSQACNHPILPRLCECYKTLLGTFFINSCERLYFAFLGGFDGSMPLNTAEYYDPKNGKWMEIARMNQCRFGVGCAVMNDVVYAVGGSDGTNLRTVERYEPVTNTWMMVASMSTARWV